MNHFRNRGEAALYLWDYFYVSHEPARGDEMPWRMIESATCRIQESEPYLAPSFPADVRLGHARRIRRAVLAILRNTARLSVEPAARIAAVLAYFEAEAVANSAALDALPSRECPASPSSRTLPCCWISRAR